MDKVPEEVLQQLNDKLAELSAERFESQQEDEALGEIDWQVYRSLVKATDYNQWLYQFTTCWPDIRTFSN